MVGISDKLNEIDKIIEEQYDKHDIPGLSIGIVCQGKLVYSKCMGYSDILEKKDVKIDSIFRLASVTKIFTAIGIMQLYEKGKITSLDDPISKYYPKIKEILIPKNLNWSEITFKNLLSHTSGFGEIPKVTWLFRKGYGMLIKGRVEPPRLVSIHSEKIKMNIEPGSKYAYSNYGFSLLGFLTEIISGERWEDFIVKNIFEPVGMTDSYLIPTDPKSKNEAKGYVKKLGKLRDAKYWVNIIGPAGNLYSSVKDITLFAEMILNGGSIREKQIIKPSSLELMKKPTYYSHEELKDEISIGLCFHLGNVGNKIIIEHSGVTSGFTSAFSLIPEDKIAVIVFSNIDEIFKSHGTLIIKNKIIQTLLDEEEKADFETFAENQKRSIIKNLENYKKFCGYYDPYPGVLTNTRVYKTGGDIHIKLTKKGLKLSRFYGPTRKGIFIFPTDNPLVFEYHTKSGSNLNTTKKIAFEENENGEITHLNMDLMHLRKNILVKTFRFRITSLIVSLLSIVALSIIISTIK